MHPFSDLYPHMMSVLCVYGRAGSFHCRTTCHCMQRIKFELELILYSYFCLQVILTCVYTTSGPASFPLVCLGVRSLGSAPLFTAAENVTQISRTRCSGRIEPLCLCACVGEAPTQTNAWKGGLLGLDTCCWTSSDTVSEKQCRKITDDEMLHLQRML